MIVEMNEEAASQKISALEQAHLLAFYNTLSEERRCHLLQQIEAIDVPLFHRQQLLVKKSQTATSTSLNSFRDFVRKGHAEDVQRGRERLVQGQVGCLVIAGGQGTRLRFEGPKGMYPISVIQHKTLFQLVAEKTRAASLQTGYDLPIAIMTSPVNHAATVNYFEQHHYFGLKRTQVSFFSQRLLPLLDEEGNLFLEDVDSIAQGPDGNGFALKYFAESGLWHKWHSQGIRYINFVLIDNPLADPFDAELVGFHEREGNDITMKCTPRRDIHEKVGVLVKIEGKAAVVEYSELPDEERKALHTDSTLKHLCANLSLFCFSMESIRELNKLELPLHLAHKAVKYVDKAGQVVQACNPMAWKFERFIFDVLPLAKHVKALLYPRAECFAPLKNFSGPDSPATVQAALQEMDRRVIEKITGMPAPHHPFELAQDFHYPTPELLEKWQGHALPSDPYYIVS